jgi:hypothetical protein
MSAVNNVESGVVQLCVRCQRRRGRFVLDAAPKCFTCAMSYWPLLRRSLLTALVVGSILTAINQGTVLVGGAFPAELYWKIPLTYSVPFCVATWGALINSRIRRG